MKTRKDLDTKKISYISDLYATKPDAVRNTAIERALLCKEITVEEIMCHRGMVRGPFIKSSFTLGGKGDPISGWTGEEKIVLGDAMAKKTLLFLGHMGLLDGVFDDGDSLYVVLNEYVPGIPNEMVDEFLSPDKVALDATRANQFCKGTCAGGSEVDVFTGSVAHELADELNRMKLSLFNMMHLEAFGFNFPYIDYERKGKIGDVNALANAMLCGNDELHLGNEPKMLNVQEEVMRLLYPFVVAPEGYGQSEDDSLLLATLMREVSKIWRQTIKQCDCCDFVKMYGRSGEDVTFEDAVYIVQYIGERLGIDAMVSSLFKGVPLDDILA